MKEHSRSRCFATVFCALTLVPLQSTYGYPMRHVPTKAPYISPVKPVVSQHGGRIKLIITSALSKYHVGEQIPISLRIFNIGSNAIRVVSKFVEPECIDVYATSSRARCVDVIPQSQIVPVPEYRVWNPSVSTIEPNYSYEGVAARKTLPLRILKPGVYTVEAYYSCHLKSCNWGGAVRSNKIRIRIS
jgi:hypothetical protein